jgi:MoxR-like ATPase
MGKSPAIVSQERAHYPRFSLLRLPERGTFRQSAFSAQSLGGARSRLQPGYGTFMNETIGEDLKGQAVAHAEKAAEILAKVRDGIGRVIFGQKDVIDQTLITLLAGGHGLLIGVPGLAKTKLVEALGTVLGLDWKRIQFTPDLMPADITGSEVLEEVDDRHRAFRFLKGPVFTQLLMADEINRASPRTQSALLQSMQERQVTVAGERYDLPVPFHVLATQNPLEQEGTYPLPEAQLDRFLLQIDVGYPDKEAEKHMLLATTFGDEAAPLRVCGPEALVAAQAIVRRLPVGEKVVESILRLVRAARPEADGAPELRDVISWGPGPRASQAFMLAARARALIDGRLSPSTDDVAALAGPVLRHRMAISFAARAEGLTVVGVIDRLCQTLL